MNTRSQKLTFFYENNFERICKIKINESIVNL